MSSYAKDLWNKIDVVLVQSIERRREMEDFTHAVNKRIEAEEIYARNIQSVGCMLDRYIVKKSAAAFTYSAFKSDHMHRAEQVRVFVTSLKDEVLTLLRGMQSEQNADFKRIEKDSRKLEKQMLEFSSKLSTIKNKLLLSEKEKEEQQITMQMLKAGARTSMDKKQKQQAKTRDSEKEFKEYQNNYKTVARQYNEFLVGYQTEVEKILNVFQQHEECRLQKQVDTIMKVLVFETAMMRNFDYDISNISQQMEGIQPRDDVKAFIKEHSDGSSKLQQQQISGMSLLSTALSKMASKQFESRLDFERNQSIKTFIEQNFKKLQVQELKDVESSQKEDFNSLIQIVDSCWNNKHIGVETINGKFKQLMDNDKNRFFFQLAFRFYGSHYLLELMENGYYNAIRLFEVAIQKSLEKKDIFTIRKLLGLIFSHWTMDPPRLSEQELERIQTKSVKEQFPVSKSKHKLLFTALTHLGIWRNQDFWQSSILESIQQELLGRHFQKEESVEQTLAKEKNIVLSQLASYSYIMIMLGTTPKNVRQSVGRFCRLYELGEEDNKDLSKTISEAWKVYKELHTKDTKNQGFSKKKVQAVVVESDFRAMMP